MNDAQNICVNGQFNAKMEMQLLFLCLNDFFSTAIC